jgi:hypothetical protein
MFSCKNDKTNIILEVAELEQMEYIDPAIVGSDGVESKFKEIYKNIFTKYSSDVIKKEYFKTDSSIAKICLYWVLRERDWHNLSIIYQDLLKIGSEEIIYYPLDYCIPCSMKLSEFIEANPNIENIFIFKNRIIYF